MREMTHASRRTVLAKAEYTTEVRSCLKEPNRASGETNQTSTNKEQEQNTSRKLSKKI